MDVLYLNSKINHTSKNDTKRRRSASLAVLLSILYTAINNNYSNYFTINNTVD